MFMHGDTLANRRRMYLGLIVALLGIWILPQSLSSVLLPAIKDSGTLTSADLGRLPLSFEPNAGHEAKPGVDKSVLFTARAGASAFYFTQSEVVMSLAAQRSSALPLSAGVLTLPNGDVPTSNAQRASSTVRLNFVGADPKPQILPGTRLPGTVNYFLGKDPAKWQTNLPTYGGITYSGLYPGINLHYEGTQHNLKGTYTLAPGADPTAIRWRYAGAESVSVDTLGNLQIEVRESGVEDQGSGSNPRLTEQAPVAWQEIGGKRFPVQVSYSLRDDKSVGFALGKYDPEHQLIIDPTLTYSTFLGGNAMEEGFAIAVDSQGNAYVTGATSSTDFPVVNPLYPPSLNGDLFVTKINPDATAIIYSTYIGGEQSDVGFGIAVDGAGSAYVTGESLSFTFPVVNAYQPEHAGYPSYNFDVIVLKLNPSGTALAYSTFLGGISDEQARDVAVDSLGNAYITGYTLSFEFPVVNAFQPTKHNIQDGFVTKFNSAGSDLVFSTFLGGSTDFNYSNSIAVDSQQAVYVAGFTGATDFPLQNPIQATNHGNGDTFITKFNPPGTSLAYSTYLGGSLNDIQYSGLAVDPSGNAYVSGYTDSSDFPIVNAYQSSKNGFEDVFLTKVNAAGTAWDYSTYLGGIFPDGSYHTAVAVDPQGNAYVGGDTMSSDFPLVNSFQTGNIDGQRDVFVTKFNPSGQELIYSTRLGGNNGGHFYNIDYLYGLALDTASNAYITGATDSPQFPTTIGVFQPTKAPFHDAFVSKISAQGPNTPTPTVTGTPPTATPTPCNANANYTVTQQSGVSIVPGTQDIGNHCEMCVTPFDLPFPVRLYDRTFTSALIGNHGSVGFVANQNFDTSQCLPPTNPPMFNYAILPFWAEVRTDGYGITCPAGGCGIFTSITGSPPNRTMHIEWRGSRFSNGNFGYVNFELRLFEGSPNFQVVYGQIFSSWENGATIGVQKDLGSMFTQYACSTPSIAPGTSLTFSLPYCGPMGSPTPQPTSTLTPPSTPTSTTVSPTRTGTSTNTPVPPTGTSVPPTTSSTSVPTITTGTPINTTTPTAAPPTVEPCTITFTDLPPGHTFYQFVRCLACRGILGGYADSTFRPGNDVTRGQLSKIVSNAAGFSEPQPTQLFADVPLGSTFQLYIGRLASRGYIGGYPCGGIGEPCGSGNLPYFRANNNATRGQISKIVSNAAGFNDPAGAQLFEDVLPGSTFYDYIQRLASRGIVSGYPCGGPGEPCGGGNLPYFRTNNNATRGQTAKIVANTFFANCQTPDRR